MNFIDTAAGKIATLVKFSKLYSDFGYSVLLLISKILKRQICEYQKYYLQSAVELKWLEPDGLFTTAVLKSVLSP